ncbi:M20 family metallopeptidase [Thalassobius sp. Cn5-15]|jgi:aminobenzoyl-glutamate utilization protein B|uniref:M20 family metallopeptidase n=1 Tax=Thalassobius sp. Cn5-15 TaxID=2917763 RepID=UPI001EF2E963|nr:M20 family metallopeptidase [Thalassobius sp. Cn5-15]MCG7492751.1 M20 family metallopeptidase [Thalassobius sp. Cn5-15]
MQNTDTIWDIVDTHRDAFVGMSDRVFDTPETLYGEFDSVAEHIAMLEEQGFKITKNVAGMPTAVIGEAGDEGPVIAILGEFDALPYLSQESGVTEPKPITEGANGHGCGHNLLGSAAMLAATAVKDWLAESGIKARVRYYGCPAEEGGAAKTYMVRDGYFDDVDFAISWHPGSYTAVFPARSLANTRIDFTFHGKASHAAGAPELGRSALDAVELMNVGVNYLREHMPDDARVHYAYIDAGGVAPNVVQHRATIRQLIRSRDLAGLRDLVARVRKIAEGAALMTETSVETQVFSAVSNLLGNRPLEEAMQAEMDRLGPVDFDQSDRAFAKQIQESLTEADKQHTFRRVGREYDPDMALCDFVAPLDNTGQGGDGSTDVGDASWAVPTVQARIATCAVGTPLHTWQMVAHGKTPIAHKGMVHAAKVMAATARRIIEDPALMQAAKDEHQSHLRKTPYQCPMPDDVNPPIIQPAG